MLRNNLSKVTLVFAIIALFFSCKKDNIEPQPKPQASKIKATVENGILTFATSDDFLEATELLQEMSMEEIQAWEKSIGFESYETYVEGILTQTDNAQSWEELHSILNKYSNFAELKDSMVTPTIKFSPYSKVMNKEGYFFADDALHKVTSNEVIISYKGSKKDIENALSGVKSEGDDIYRSYYRLTEPKLKASKLHNYEITKTVGNYRLSVNCEHLMIIIGYTVDYFVRFTSTSYTKGLWWRQYYTAHRWDSWTSKLWQPVRIEGRQLIIEREWKNHNPSGNSVHHGERKSVMIAYLIGRTYRLNEVDNHNSALQMIRERTNTWAHCNGTFHIRPFGSQVLTY